MLNAAKNPAAPDYRLCNMTVTVFHRQDETYSKQVFYNAFLDFKKTQNTDKTGQSEVNSFLLVMPCEKQTVFVGDKVVLGEWEDITSPGQWAAFIPSKVQGLVVVRYVDVKYCGGRLTHIEAGG